MNLKEIISPSQASSVFPFGWIQQYQWSLSLPFLSPSVLPPCVSSALFI